MQHLTGTMLRLEVGSNQTGNFPFRCIWNIPPHTAGTIHLFLSRFSFSSFGGSETKQFAEYRLHLWIILPF